MFGEDGFIAAGGSNGDDVLAVIVYEISSSSELA